MALDSVQLLSTAAAPSADQARAWLAFARWLPALRLVRAVEGGALRAWLPPGAGQVAAEHLPPGTQVALLDCLLQADGASAGADARWHYVVETDVLPEYEHEFNAWYEQEHLPGLAQVHGTVAALRLLSREAGPRYHACYDLVSPETLGSPPWLAVRATPWSSRIRAAFRNTRRTMYQRFDLPRG